MAGKMKAMIPSYGQNLNDKPKFARTIRNNNTATV
jgi:hypothetical protein